jgi:hypothetical protein
MLRLGLALTDYAVMASDGNIGTVRDFLFDDRTWKLRWRVVDKIFVKRDIPLRGVDR